MTVLLIGVYRLADSSAASRGALPHPPAGLSEAAEQRQEREHPRIHHRRRDRNRTPRPRPFNPPEGRWVLVSLNRVVRDGRGAVGRGLVRVFNGTTLLHSFPASGGRPSDPTPIGELFSINFQDLHHRSSSFGHCIRDGVRSVVTDGDPCDNDTFLGSDRQFHRITGGVRRRVRGRRGRPARLACRSNETYLGADMHHYQNFAPMVGFHRGDPADLSHGCIHLHRDHAARLFGEIEIGTRVIVCAGEQCQRFNKDILAAQIREAKERDERGRGD
jgi:hypothetical protein